MRTEGVIKVGLMMEERIFDFDRQCGSHARRPSLYLCLCTSFTLSLFTKRDRVGARRFRSPFIFFSSPAQSESLRREQICISFLSGVDWWTALHVFFVPPLFSHLDGRIVSGSFHFLCSRLLWFRPVPQRPYDHARYAVPGAVPSLLIVSACRPSCCAFLAILGCKSCYRVISTYMLHYLSSLGAGKPLDNAGPGLIVSPFGF